MLAFADHWKTVTGHDPKLLIFDSKVTTQPSSPSSPTAASRFITLRARTPKLTAALHALPASAWKPLTDRPRRRQDPPGPSHRRPRRHPSSYPGTLRQLAVAGLGHDEPTILITNDLTSPAKKIIERYARRMNIEQRLAEAIRSFGLDALAGAVPLNVDLDVVLSVLAHTVCAALRRRLPGYATATPDILQRRFLQHRRRYPQPGERDRRPTRPARLLTRPTPSRPPPPSPSPGGATADSATSSPDPTGVEFAA